MTKLEYAIEGARRRFFPPSKSLPSAWIGYKHLWKDGTSATAAGVLVIECVERVVRKRVLSAKGACDPMLESDVPNLIYLLSNPVWNGKEWLAPTEKAKECVSWLEAIAAAQNYIAKGGKESASEDEVFMNREEAAP
jgi:hypothetical protein